MNIQDVQWQVIANPNALTAKRKMLEKTILQDLQAHGINYRLHVADGIGHGMELACQLCQAGHRHLIAVGGDGTVNEVVNGIYQSGVPADEVFMAIIPLGTGNDFCRTLGYPGAADFRMFLQRGSFLPTDVGMVETVVGGAATARRRFINIAGFAFDAAVIRETTKGKPKLFPSAVYLLKLVKVLFSYRATPVTIVTADGEMTDEIFTMAVGNAQYNGNGMRQVPMADPHDRMLDIVAIRKIRPMKVIANVKRLFSGEHLRLPEARVLHGDRVEIRSKEPVPGEVEGEMLSAGNYCITLESKQLNLLQKGESTH